MRLKNTLKYQGCTTKINAHGRSQISALIINDLHPNQIVSIAQDGFIKKWEYNSFTLLQSLRIKTGYLTSLINFDKGFLIGTGKGQLIKLTNTLQIQWSKKLHLDCITDIIQVNDYLITISFDGKILFLNKSTFREQKQINMEVPLLKVIQIDNYLYISANPSFKVDLKSNQVFEVERCEMMMEFQKRVLCCSDEKGFGILNGMNSFQQCGQYISCHFMLPFKNRIITISQRNIGEIEFDEKIKIQSLAHLDDHNFSYRCYKTNQLKQGYAIKAGIVIENAVILAGEDGMIYRFNWMEV